MFCSCADQQLTREDLVEKREFVISSLMKLTGKIVFVDEFSRTKFLRDASETLVDLISGDMQGKDRYRRLLIGRKGVGKTAILTALLKSASQLLGHLGLLTIYIRYDLFNDRNCLPTDAVMRNLSLLGRMWIYLQERFTYKSRLDLIEDYLLANNLTVFGVIDEFQNVYTADMKCGKRIVWDMCGIGGSQKGVMHWILSGSSSDLRLLATAKLPIARHKEYINYSGLDLNETKFVPITISPFLDTIDFKNFMLFLNKGADILDDSELSKLYIQCGGLPAIGVILIGKKYHINDDYTISIKGIAMYDDFDSKLIIFRAITLVLDSSIEIRPASLDGLSLEKLSVWTQLVDYHLVYVEAIRLTERNAEIKKKITGDFFNLCCDLSDRGLIRFLNDFPKRKLGLASPLMIHEIWTESMKVWPESVKQLGLKFY